MRNQSAVLEHLANINHFISDDVTSSSTVLQLISYPAPWVWAASCSGMMSRHWLENFQRESRAWRSGWVLPSLDASGLIPGSAFAVKKVYSDPSLSPGDQSQGLSRMPKSKMLKSLTLNGIVSECHPYTCSIDFKFISRLLIILCK